MAVVAEVVAEAIADEVYHFMAPLVVALDGAEVEDRNRVSSREILR